MATGGEKYVLQGCKDFREGQPLPLPRGTRLVKSGRLRTGEGQHAYREGETDTWYQVTEILDPRTRRRQGWKLCEYVGADCPCAHGGG